MKNKITPNAIHMLIQESTIEYKKMGQKTCVLCCTLPNSAEFTVSYHFLNAEDYDEEYGRTKAMQLLGAKIWEMETYAFHGRLTEPVEA